MKTALLIAMQMRNLSRDLLNEKITPERGGAVLVELAAELEQVSLDVILPEISQ